ncbi:hypothetical protein SEA_GIANTSBANE_62 [Arthrobacter phage Giantsbane]|nr:hypothetical protein SEA_GIANTSBANE_62 [Arthrobacter phage Giantsbane]
MSETPNEKDPMDNYMQETDDDNGAAELEEARLMLPQTEVILPVIMPKGDKLAVLGDAVFDPDTNKMVVSFNTEAGRDIAEFIGTGMLAAISFTGHMRRNEATNRLN